MADAAVNENATNWLNKTTKNYPNNPLRPLEISQATYETLLLIYMNDMGEDESSALFFWRDDATKQNNEYMKALGTFILGEAVADYLWPSNWLKLLHEEVRDIKKWHTALKNHKVTNADKQYVGTVLEALTKRTILSSNNFNAFLNRDANPVDKNYANLEPGSQKSFPSALTTRRVLEPLIIPYRKAGMDCDPRNPATNLDALSRWFTPLEPNSLAREHTVAFTSSMVDFYKANIFPDPELFLPYMIALSPSLRNAQLAIEEYKSFVTNEVTPKDTDDCCDPFLSYLFNKQIPAIPNFEKNYLLLAEKFNTNRDYLKVSVGPIIENMVLPIAVKFGVFTTNASLKQRRVERAKAQRTIGHTAFTQSFNKGALVNVRVNTLSQFWHAQFRDLIFSYQDPKRFYFPHWLYACSSRYIAADAALRDRDFVVINVEDPKKRAYVVRWCNIKNFLSRDACNLAVLMSKTGDKVNKMHIMAFQDYIQMIPRPQDAVELNAKGLEKASFSNCFEKICAPNSSAVCFPPLSDASPLPELP
jgi:hypothetical protein